MPYMPGIWRMYSSLTGSGSPYQRKVIFKELLQGGVISMYHEAVAQAFSIRTLLY
jgi:hypothetical protein